MICILIISFFVRNHALLENLYPPSPYSAIKLLYADEDILVLNKPPNMNTAPGVVDSNSLAQHAAEVFKVSRVDHMIAHRLDYGTSGVVVLARITDALASLHAQFRSRRQIFKKYSAVVHGRLPSLEGEIDLPIGRDLERGPPYFCIQSETGKSSVTHWHVIAASKERALLSLRPITGRTHQLRIHMQALGHPISGDPFYFNEASAEDDKRRGLARLYLHAETLGLIHPRTQIPMQFNAPSNFGLVL